MCRWPCAVYAACARSGIRPSRRPELAAWRFDNSSPARPGKNERATIIQTGWALAAHFDLCAWDAKFDAGTAFVFTLTAPVAANDSRPLGPDIDVAIAYIDIRAERPGI